MSSPLKVDQRHTKLCWNRFLLNISRPLCRHCLCSRRSPFRHWRTNVQGVSRKCTIPHFCSYQSISLNHYIVCYTRWKLTYYSTYTWNMGAIGTWTVKNFNIIIVMFHFRIFHIISSEKWLIRFILYYLNSLYVYIRTYNIRKPIFVFISRNITIINAYC